MAQRGFLHEVGRNRQAYLFISPFFVLFVVFGLYPILYSLVLSLHEWKANKPWTYVGLKNYATLLFKDQVFWTSLYNVVYVFILNVPVMIFLSVVIAVALNNPARKHKDFFRIVYLLPYVTSVLSIAIVFYVLFDDNARAGQPPPGPPGNPGRALAHLAVRCQRSPSTSSSRGSGRATT